MTEPVLSEPGVLRNFTHPDFPAFWGQDTGGGGEPVKGAVRPMDEFPPDPAITAQDNINSAKLVGLGYLPANPSDLGWESMGTGKFAVGDYWFSWVIEDSMWVAGPQ